jgi:hypothetical protein
MSVTIKTERLPAFVSADWERNIAAYRIARATEHLGYAQPEVGPPEEHEARHAATSDALHKLILSPAPTINALRQKIGIIDVEQIDDGFWCAREVISILACDAERLLRWVVEEDA